MTDLKVSRSNLIPDYILKSCWVQTVNAGLYNLGDPNAGQLSLPDWSRCLVGDRDFTLLKIRIESYGPLYTFKTTCPSCRERFEWDIDLSVLPTKTLSKADRETYLNGNRFTVPFPKSEKNVTFKLITGLDVQRAAVLRKESRIKSKSKKLEGDENMIVESILLRVTEIEGVAEGEKHPKRRRDKMIDFLEDSGMDQITELLDLMDEHDCGIETTIEVTCFTCERSFDQNLPFEGDFFFPRKSTKVVGSTTKSRDEETEGTEETEAAAE